MKRYITTTLLAIMALCMTSCQKDITAGEDLSTLHLQPATVHVTANAYGSGTRTVNSGYSVTFEAGDQIGVYVLGKNLLENNVCFTYNGTAWIPSKTIEYCDEYIYYAYYPYVADAYAPDFSQETVDDMFAEYITDAGDKFHRADQSTKAAFNASDLMIGEGIPDGSGTVAFTLDHKKGLAVFNGGYAVASFSGGNIPYSQDGKGWYHMKSLVAYSFTDDTDGYYILYASKDNYTQHRVTRNYLTFIALEDGTFSFSKAGLSYSLDDGETWTALAAGTNTPTVRAGSKIMWKNNTTISPTYAAGIGKFSSTGAFNIKGNIMSLYYGDDAVGKTSLDGKRFAFKYLFQNTMVVNARQLHLPATTLAESCYEEMFRGCTSLTAGPVLPATTLAKACYYYMFRGCTSLTATPDLPATTLANNCYDCMFYDCTSLVTVSTLPATTMVNCCYLRMFMGCSSLTTAPTLPATTLAESCYGTMFDGCTSLLAAPELPVTTLADECYAYMFHGCTSLTSAPALPATTLADACYQAMFWGCTSLTSAPELPATTLVSNCYTNMFNSCSNLNYVKAAFTTTPAKTYTNGWLIGVAATGTFYKNSAASWDVTGVNGIPSSWTVETYTP